MGNLLSRRQLLLSSAAALAASACGPAQNQGPAGPTPPGAGGGSPKKIIIIGGGLSGLAIALDLAGRGFDPTVLEASDRPGGRIHTIRAPLPEGLYVEAGATWVVPDPDLMKLMKDVGVELTEGVPRPKGLKHVMLRGDKRIILQPGEEPPEEYELSAEEKAMPEPFGPMKKYFSIVNDIDVTKPLPASLSQYDAMSAADFLKKQGASPGYIKSFHDSFAPDVPLEQLSALFMMREIANIMREVALEGPNGRVAGGTDRFPALIAEKLGKRVVYGAHVRRIEQTAAGVRVTFSQKGQSHTMEGGRAVCALPSTVLRDIEMAPALPEGKQRALRELTMVSATRVWMAEKERFWLARGESGTVMTDAPLGTVRDETDRQAGKAGVVGLYVSGAEARRLAAMSEAQRIEAALGHGERAIPGLRENFIVGISKSWDEDPLQRGAYAHFAPGQMTTLLPELARAEGRLHFAGDQTSYRPGFMHGAVASARRVVDEIVRAG